MDKFVIDRESPEIKEVLQKMNISGFRPATQEQIIFRIYCCQNCFKARKCSTCSCDPHDKVMEPFSCNPKVYPNIKSEIKWEQYKLEHNIVIL